MRRARAAGRTAALLAMLAGLLTGCGLTHLDNLSFRVDDRLHFTRPADRALVRQPFTVSWNIEDFRVAAPGSEPPSRDAGYFAVFVDETPIRPGESVEAVGDGDPACEQDPKCPDKQYLAERQVFVTTHTSVRLDQIISLPGKDDIQLHAVTVVLLDTTGHRIGESAWQLDLRMRRVGL